MGTIAEKLNYLNTTKTNIKNAIIEKGVSVSDNDTFRSYASKIADIEPTLGTKTITANGTYTASDDSLQGYSSVTVDIDDTDLYRDTTDSTYESVKTLSNCGAFPMLSLTAEINAVQDLHGYDHPWAGGAGKNKLLINSNTIVKPNWYTSGWADNSLNDKNGITQSRRFEDSGAGGVVIKLGEGTYTYSHTYTGSGIDCKIYVAAYDGTNLNTILGNLTMIKSDNRYYYTFDIPSGTIEFCIRPTVQGGSVPYDLIDMQIEEGTTATSYEPYSNECPITGWDSIDVYQSGADTSNPTTHTTALSTTCYGGSKDIKGNERFTHAILDLGDLDWVPDSTVGKFRTNNFSSYGMKWGSVPLCTQYKGVFKSTDMDYGEIAITNSSALPFLRVYDSTKSSMTATEFKEAVRGVKMVYELATPTTATSDAIDLTLAEGVNNVWANSGDVGDARYFKKVEL